MHFGLSTITGKNSQRSPGAFTKMSAAWWDLGNQGGENVRKAKLLQIKMLT